MRFLHFLSVPVFACVTLYGQATTAIISGPGGVSPFPYSYDPKNPRFITPAAVGGLSLDYVWPYSYQLNFSVQREVGRDFTVSGAYVSTLAHHLPFTVDANYPFYGPGATAANVDQRRPYQTGQLSQI